MHGNLCASAIAGEIFRERGESGFRLAETSALRDLAESLEHETVVALGGGAFAQTNNRELLKRWPSVFLEAPAPELWQRSLTDSVERPLRRDPKQFARLYAERLPFYRQATVTVVTSGKDPASLCAEIERTLQFRVQTGPDSIQHPSDRFGTGESN